MAAAVEGPFPLELLVKERSPEPSDAVVFVGISLALGVASRHLLRGTRVPYTVALLIIGIGLGSLAYGTSHRLGKVGDGINLWANINPDLLLAVFLPALLFESSFSMEVHQIKKCMVQMVILAGPGVLISTFCLGSALKLTFPYNWSWKTSLLLGGLLSATDPVAVVALLRELGASKKLSTIIEGESLMNDGTAIVVYQLFYQMVLGQSFNVGDIIKFLTQVALGAVGIGLAFGIASVLWLGFIFNDTVIEIALTLAVSYIAYFTAQDGAAVSGVLTVMTLGMFYSAAARTAFKGEGHQSLHHFWEMVAYIANTLIFILSGLVIAQGVLHGDHHFEGNAHYLNPDLQYTQHGLVYEEQYVEAVKRVIDVMEPDVTYATLAMDELKYFREGTQGFTDRMAVADRTTKRHDPTQAQDPDDSSGFSGGDVRRTRSGAAYGGSLADDDDDDGGGGGGGDQGGSGVAVGGSQSQGPMKFTCEEDFTHATQDTDHGDRRQRQSSRTGGDVTYSRKGKSKGKCGQQDKSKDLLRQMETLSMSTEPTYNPCSDSSSGIECTSYGSAGINEQQQQPVVFIRPPPRLSTPEEYGQF